MPTITAVHQIFIFPYGKQWMYEEFTERGQEPARDVYHPRVFPTSYMTDTPVEFVEATLQRNFPDAYVDNFETYEKWQNG